MNNNKKLSSKTPKNFKIKYENNFKKPKGKFLEETLPKSLTPTKRTERLFEIFLLLSIAMSLVNFPLGELMSGSIETSITIGYPLPFIQVDFMETSGSIMKIWNFILDILIYLVLAYIIDIIITLMFTDVKNCKKNSKIN
jgi:hypothetical protein